MLEDMVTAAEKNSSQFVVTGFYIDTYYTDSEKFVQEQAYKDCVYPTQQAFREDAHHLFDLNLLYSPWNKLFLTEYVKGNGIYFPQTFWDDFPFIFKRYPRCGARYGAFRQVLSLYPQASGK